MQRRTLKILIVNAFVAALYAALTISLYFLSYGEIQVRVAEALTILPFFSGYYIIGITLGCFIANIFSIMKLDMIFGTLATFIGACLTYFIGKSNIRFKKYIAPLPPVLSNAVIVGIELKVVQHTPFLINAAWVAIGEIISCFGLGIPLMSFLKKNKALNKIIIFR